MSASKRIAGFLSGISGKKRDVDMTKGSIVGNILRFAFPLLIGNLFQQLYNMVDTWVIGQTGENGAYAAVGSVGPIINILIGFFLGLSSGAGVVISQYYGAKNEKKVQDAVHTSIALTLIFGVLFTVIGVLMAPLMLDLMLESNGNESDVTSYALTYLTIYFSGIIGLMIYNMGAGILRAVGDSERPFYFLVCSAVTNTLLDLLFVFGFEKLFGRGMGVAGVALATIIAQGLSAILVLITLCRSKSCIRLSFRRLRLDWSVLKKILLVGLPAALQMAITAFSNVFVQSYVAGVNGNQTYCLGGWTSYSKIDQFIFLPVQSISLAVTTFVGQNLGVGDKERAKKGTYMSFGISLIVTAVLIVIIEIFTPFLAGIFNDDPGVSEMAELLLRYLTPFYLFCCVNQVFSAALRGAGDSRAPMLIMLGTFVLFRQIYLFVMSTYISNELLPVAFSYPAGWFLCCVATLLYFRYADFGSKRLIEETPVPEKA